MTQSRGPMVLSAFLMPAGYDRHAWHLEGSRAEEFSQFSILRDMAQRFEAAKFDSVFIADALGGDFIRDNDLSMGNPYEPITALSALIPVTTHIGLIGTISTTFTHPYNTARQLAALDQLSGGRVGWNIVTSSWGGNSFGITMPPREERYARAEEFVAFAKGLWSCWSDETLVVDRATGTWADPSKIKAFSFEGAFFKCEDAYLNIPRSPQGHTVLVQAGQSAGGLKLGAEVAEIIYTVQPEQDKSIAYYAAQKQRVADAGRNPEEVKILPGIIPYVGRTGEEAQALFKSVVSKMDMDKLRKIFVDTFKIELEDIGYDDAVPAARFDAVDPKLGGSRILAYRDYAVLEGRTLRDLLVNHSSAMGHILAVGTPAQIADIMIDWYEKRACDGFSVNTPSYPGGCEAICDLLIPELQRRGYARTEYVGTTLRQNLGLPHPAAWDKQ